MHKELSSSFCLVDTFQNCFFFNTIDQKVNNAKYVYFQKLNKVFKDFLQDSNTVLILSDASIKNQVVISITYIQYNHNIVAKTIHHAVNITTTKAKLFAISCGIN